MELKKNHARESVYPVLPTPLQTLPASSLLFSALVLLRQQIVADLEIPFVLAARLGLLLGWFYDAVAVVAVACAALVIEAALGLAWRKSWSFLAVLLWIPTLANVLYYRYFEGELELWVLRFHLGDVPFVWSIALNLASTWLVGSSVVFLALAVWAALRTRAPAERTGRRARPEPRIRLALAGSSLLVLALAIGAHQAVGWAQLYDRSEGPVVLKDQVLQIWIRDLPLLSHEPQTWNWRAEMYRRNPPRRLTPAEKQRAFAEISTLLARYRDYRDPEAATAPQPTDPPLSNPAPASVHTLFGFESEAPVNVIMLFVEGLRTFELEHPEIAPAVLPRLRRVLDEHAILFTQAYSSAFRAGQTVRGQFCTLCSMLPNMGGSATYFGQPFLRINCLPSAFLEAGYETLWLNSFSRSYHNKSVFEAAHGTRHFYDETYFRKKGVVQKIGPWGLADRQFLEQSMDVFRDFSHKRLPFFANILTISSHPPFSVIDQGRLPDSLMEDSTEVPEYQGYLSRLRYVDESLGHFFDLLFSSQLAQHTLVVLLGDHSTGVRPHLALSRVQLEEIKFRIPLALISRDLLQSKRIAHPAHQVDVAPTVARIAGIQPRRGWIGRDLLSGPGSPWIYSQTDVFHYRTGGRGCYTLPADSRLTCRRTAAELDPLFSADLQPVEEEVGQTQFFRAVAAAAGEAIGLDLVLAPAN